MIWYTIPDAPNYEINSKLQCRNKKTGNVLKPVKNRHNSGYYSLRVTGQKNCVKRTPKILLAQARAAVQPSTFEPVPSLDYKYEVNIHGKVRNAKTKLPIKSYRGIVFVRTEKYISASVNSLLWEVHGIIKATRSPCPCTAENNICIKQFPNMKACARFVAERTHQKFLTVYRLIYKFHKTELFGWKITYLDKDPC